MTSVEVSLNERRPDESIPGERGDRSIMKRIPELDGIRAIAVTMVLVCHTEYLTAHAPKISNLMVVGVDLFFVLSGYLITEIILRNHTQAGFIKNFYMRRTLRIWPIYYLFLAIHFLTVMVAGPLSGSRTSTPGEVLRFLTFTQTLPFSVSVTSVYRALRHLWSLSVEEQFYLFWPFLTLLLPRKWLGAALCAIAAGAVLVRLLPMQELQNITSRADGLALGALLALVLHRRSWAGSRPEVLWVYLLGLMVGAAAGPFLLRVLYAVIERSFGVVVPGSVRFSFDLFCFNMCCVGLVGLAVCRSGSLWLRPLRQPFLVRVGLLSYGLYLYHPPVLRLVAAWSEPVVGALLAAALGWCASYGIAELSWACVEQPVLRLKDRFGYRSRSTAPAEAPALPAGAVLAEPPGS